MLCAMLFPPRPAVFLFLTSLLLGQSFALPHGVFVERSLIRRQDAPYTGPQNFQTVVIKQTAVGIVTETCKVSMTPTTDANGNNAVIDVKSCKVSVSSNGNKGGSPPPPANAGAPAPPGNTTDNPPPPPASSALSPPPASNGTTSTPPSPADTDPAVSVIGVTYIPLNSTSSSGPSAPPLASANTSAPAATTSNNSTAATPVGNSSALSTASGTAANNAAASPSAAAENSPSPTPFVLPGKKLQVLPIGLGVFAGISVIALIVVGLVTYERTKYRKAFRQRKLAESGASMGYGGMAQRV